MALASVTMTFDELRDVLAPALASALQEQANGSQPATGAQEEALARVMESIQGLIQDQANRPAAAAVAGIPLPEVDAELLPLQTEVDGVVARLGQLRAEVPELLAAAMKQQVEALRPALTEDTTTAQDQGAAPASEAPAEAEWTGTAGALEATWDPEQLQGALADALNKLPGLRARLTAVTSRLQRNVDAVHSSQRAGDAAAPTTVDRLLRASRRRDSGGAEGAALAAGPSTGSKGQRRRSGGGAAEEEEEEGEDGTLQRLAEQLVGVA